MDFGQLSTQIGTQPAGGELKAFGGGDPLGVPSRAREFSTVFHAVSDKTGGNREAKPRAPQAEVDDRPSTATPAVHRTASHKADDSRGGKPRDPQAKTDDGPSTTTSDVSTIASHETSSSTDTESRASQSATGDTPSTTTSGSDPLLLSLLGASIVTPASTVASTQEAGSTDVSTSQGEGLSGISGTPAIQPIALPAEGVTSAVSSETGFSDRAGRNTTSATGDAVAALSSPMIESQPLSAGTDRITPVVEKSDSSHPLIVGQVQEAESSGPHQKLSIMAHSKESLPQALVPSGQATANGQDPAQLATTVTTQPTDKKGEGVAVQPDRSLAQQILGKAEPSLHQRNMPAESSETQKVAALSGHTQTEGQGFNQASDGQRKEEGLKWFSHVDLQSAEVSLRQPQESVAEPLDAGRQSLSYQQGQGGTPSSIQPVPTATVPPPSQANRLSHDPETAPAPLTHSVQFDLAPADFGQLRVRVVLSDQTVHTHLSTDRAELGQMLTSQQEQLSTQLSAAGLDLGRFQVQVDQGRTNQSGQEWQSHPQPQSDTSQQQQRDSRQQDHSPETPVPSQKRTGMLSLFA